MDEISGNVWIFDDDVDTDGIVAGKYLDAPMEEILDHVLESVRPGFAAGVRNGDVIVAGRNFGCGSSRENAATTLKQLGIACVAAESFGRIFFRNAVAVGLPAIVCHGGQDIFSDGDIVSIRLETAELRNLSKGGTLQGSPLSADMLGILEAGGIMEYLVGKGGLGQ